jgi:hypothetical protein
MSFDFHTIHNDQRNNVYPLITRNIHKTRSYRPFMNEKLCLLATGVDGEAISGYILCRHHE